ncbi:hypothetical protein [Corallococcus carmarthensis]|uniref:Uncharacterized protein n=1 Tax=Corallococcus carmarthensis TaxID=2316728 RepID=A0A3A8JW50_9BACT|nr:hypothetical protein [Corallococcus carmarthensis]RKG99455.1 hypothetical protein D7X32_26375 [Corallococcus carmarthensis]
MRGFEARNKPRAMSPAASSAGHPHAGGVEAGSSENRLETFKPPARFVAYLAAMTVGMGRME